MQHIQLERKEGQEIFFTSDTHFGHRNIISFCHREYNDVKEMNLDIINKWNSVVKPTDIVFHLGDVLWFDGRHEAKWFMNRLNGIIYVIPGNHDKRETFELCKNVILCDDITVLHIDNNKINIVLCHYPLTCFAGSNKGWLQFFGHIHSAKNSVMTDFKRPINILRGQQLDVGCDRHDLTPQPLEKLITECKSWKQ